MAEEGSGAQTGDVTFEPGFPDRETAEPSPLAEPEMDPDPDPRPVGDGTELDDFW